MNSIPQNNTDVYVTELLLSPKQTTILFVQEDPVLVSNEGKQTLSEWIVFFIPSCPSLTVTKWHNSSVPREPAICHPAWFKHMSTIGHMIK